jgi:hypothetical protein
MRWSIFALCLAAALGLAPNTARADAIDGHWCAKPGRITIDGEKVTTPGKNKITGNYDRHAFSYTVPAGEKGAGSIIDMVMLDENTIHLKRAKDRQGLAKAKLEIWKRCEFTA